ncbi:hypothetical protein [Clostridium estertheticum]|uniref:Uncharacterized protein n=1 Tax=Clostridium estertheticum TaxID=238834 RepID=A0A7Y3WU63_9CLOT|nr:hypothetical protein [Clostridium estertheticum]NNU77836.1 hypothetical protein [Clostridium estertheticum]WBL46117.1 hypothetical protein LOR37_15720 [Clostridium estertheticum]
MKQNVAINYPQKSLVIGTEEDWHNFMDKFLPGIKYTISVNFATESLIYDGAFPPSSIYAKETKISDLSIKNKKIEAIIYFVNNGIYAQNIDNIKHCFVNIVKINKSDIPKNIENIYHK